MKRTKTKLVSSIVTLLICFAMLIGSTFAWFTDSASTGVNKIQAGNLDIEVSYKKDGTNWTSIQDETSLFSNNLWEPGHTEYVTLKVENKGSLALKYKVMVTPVSENGGINVDNENFKLSDYLVFGTTPIVTTEPTYTRDTARTAVGTTLKLNQENLSKESTMEKNAAPQYITLVVYMPETVDNKANAKSGTAAPSIDLGIKVVATQLEKESDSFGTDYDAGAVYGSVGPTYNYFPQIMETESVNTSGNTTITATGKLNATDASPTTLATVTVPYAAVDNGVTELTVTVKPQAASNTNAQATIQEEIARGRETANFDIKVSGIKAGNTEPISVTVYVGTGLSNVKAFHNGTAIPGATYDSGNGMLSFKTTSFSDYTVSYDAAVAAIGTKVYGSLAEAIKAVPSNGAEPTNILVLRDVTNAEGMSVEKGKKFVVDFAGHTYELNKPGAGSKGTETNGFQLLKESTITFKNGKIVISEENLTPIYGSDGKARNIMRIIQNYSNLTLDNMTIDGTNQYGGAKYVMSFNNDSVLIKGNTNIIASEGVSAFDADGNWGGYERCKVTIDTTGTIVGNIELGQGYIDIKNANVKGGISLCTSCSESETTNQKSRISITGGTFSSDPSEYLTNGYEVMLVGDRYVVKESPINVIKSVIDEYKESDSINESAALEAKYIFSENETIKTIYNGENTPDDLDFSNYNDKDIKGTIVINSDNSYENATLNANVTIGNDKFVASDVNLHYDEYNSGKLVFDNSKTFTKNSTDISDDEKDYYANLLCYAGIRPEDENEGITSSNTITYKYTSNGDLTCDVTIIRSGTDVEKYSYNGVIKGSNGKTISFDYSINYTSNKYSWNNLVVKKLEINDSSLDANYIAKNKDALLNSLKDIYRNNY